MGGGEELRGLKRATLDASPGGFAQRAAEIGREV